MSNIEQASFSGGDSERVDRQTETVSLSDGRTVSYLDCGDPAGDPILYFHGSPGSRYEGWFFDRPARERGYRVIAPDRPGIGKSDYDQNYSLLSYTSDVAELASKFGFDQFDVIGLSGGGTTALSCAVALPNRVTTVGLVCSWAPVGSEPQLADQLAPLDRVYKRLTALGPIPFVPAFSILGVAAQQLSPETFTVKLLSGSLSNADRRVLSDPDLQRFMTENTRESFRTGARGPARDAYLRYRDWEFDIADVLCPVKIHHGTDDSFAPYAFGEYLHDNTPTSTLYTYSNRGHLGFFTDLDTVLESLDADSTERLD